MSSDSSTLDRLSRAIVPSFVRSRISYKIGALLLVVLVLVATVGGVGYVRAQETVTTNTERQMQSTASLQSDAVSNWVSSMKRQTSSIATEDIVGTGAPDEVQRYLNRQGNSFDLTVRNAYVLDTERSEIVASTAYRSQGQSLGERSEPWADSGQYDSLGESSYNVSISEGSYQAELGTAVYFAAPVSDAEDRVVVLVGGVQELVGGLYQPYADQHTTIVDGSGSSVIAGNGATPPSGIIDSSGDGGPSVVDDDSSVHAATSIDGADWAIVTTVPREQAFQTVRIVGQSMLLVVGVGLFGLLAVAAVVGRQTAGPLSRLRDKAQTMEGRTLDVDFETERADEIGQLYRGFGSMRDALREQISEAEAAREDAEAAQAATAEMNRHLEAKADEYSEVMRDAADGDFTARMMPDAENEAMNAIAEEFNDTIAAIEETTATVKRFASEVAVASEQVTAGSEEVRNANEQVSESIQRISDGATRQHDQMEEATTELNTLSSVTEEIASSSGEVATLAERTATAGSRGRDAARTAADDMAAVADNTAAVVDQFERLKAETEQIDELIEFVEEIAKQTNMLALNANIEASRSGDGDNDGFGVVAKEVKELSQESQEATETIREQLTALQEEADDAATVVEQTNEQVVESVDSVEEAVTALEDIASYAERTNDGIQEINTATDDQAKAVSETARMVDDVAEISKETSVESESVAASAEEQTSALTQVSQNAGSLAEQAATLHETLDQFETDAEADGANGASSTLGTAASFEDASEWEDAIPEEPTEVPDAVIDRDDADAVEDGDDPAPIGDADRPVRSDPEE